MLKYLKYDSIFSHLICHLLYSKSNATIFKTFSGKVVLSAVAM